MLRRTIHPIVAIFVLVCCAAAGAAPPISSSFSSDAEGWTIADLNCSDYGQVVGGGTITWFASGGAPGGFIRSTDPATNCYSYESPVQFEGDRSDYVGGELRWFIRTNVADWTPGSVLILIGADQVLVADVPQPTPGDWMAYSVSLVNSSFRLDDTNGTVPSPEQFAATMAALTSIRICAEFGSEEGEETVDLDSVTLLGDCPADLGGNGSIDATDLAILLGAWGSTNDPAIDLDQNGTVDASDIALLLKTWGEC